MLNDIIINIIAGIIGFTVVTPILIAYVYFGGHNYLAKKMRKSFDIQYNGEQFPTITKRVR
jgi:hypothetical protein